jgi:hypothetical protein
MLWRHVVINTHGTWLHGDARGFRSRKHRIHSSGDYRNPPLAGEHSGLHAYHSARCPDEVTILSEIRSMLGRAVVEFLLQERYRVLCVAVTKVHAHALVELPVDLRQVKRIIGEAKRFSSCRVSGSLPGAVWSAGGKFVPVTTPDHLERAYDYDLYDQGPGAWTWSFRDRSRVGVMGRTRPRAPRSGAAPSLPRRGRT